MKIPVQTYAYRLLQSSNTQGTIFMPKTRKHKTGVILLTGIFNTRKQYTQVSTYIAQQGLLVYAIDLPSQGESKGKWTLGNISQAIQECVQGIKEKFEVEKVIVAGHSAGAMGTLLSSIKYNTYIEEAISTKSAEILKILRTVNEKTQAQEIVEILNPLAAIKKRVVQSIQRGGAEYGVADGYILLGTPDSFQKSVPGPAYTALEALRKTHILQAILNILVNTPNNMRSKKRGHEQFLTKQSEDELRVFHLHIQQAKEFIEYMKNIFNPTEYMQILNYFSKEDEQIKQFLNAQKNIPKLFVYGDRDHFLREYKLIHIFKRHKIGAQRTSDIENTYREWGNVCIKRLEERGHPLTQEDAKQHLHEHLDLARELVTDKETAQEILTFVQSLQ